MKFGKAVSFLIVALCFLDVIGAQTKLPNDTVSKLESPPVNAAKAEKQVLGDSVHEKVTTTADSLSSIPNGIKHSEKPVEDADDVQNKTSNEDKGPVDDNPTLIGKEESSSKDATVAEMMSDIREPVMVDNVGLREPVSDQLRATLDMSQIRRFNLAAQAVANNPYLALNFMQSVARAQKKLKSGLMDYLSQGGLKNENSIYIITKE